MQIVGPERYHLNYTPETFTVLCPRGTNNFTGIASSLNPKLYIVSIDEKPIYVGMTKQRLRQRLRYGWIAAGRGGYYGYAWRHQGGMAKIDVWEHADAVNRNEREIETVEAEVVFLIRLITGQWPGFQTEIHFYPSTDEHRRIAEDIVGYYGLVVPSLPRTG